MAKCKECSTEDNIVYSGVDAFLLEIDGAETGTLCYKCARQLRDSRREKEKAANNGDVQPE